MNTQTLEKTPIMVKIGASRQVAIPKRIHSALNIKTGDYFEVLVRENKITLTPKILTDKNIDEQIAEGLEDIASGRVYGPFKTARAMTASLRKNLKTIKRA